MDILDILTVTLPKDIYQFIIVYGFAYFLLIFYGTKQWDKYSSFEKVVFSVLSGYVVWVFFVFPISFFMNTLDVFQRELSDIKYTDLYKYLYIFNYIFAYLIVWRLLFSKQPLRDNKIFFKFTKYLITAILIIFFMADYLYLVSFTFSEYQEYLGYAMYSFFYLLAISIFYLIFLEIYGEKFIIISKIKKDNSFKNLYCRLIFLKYIILKREKKIKQLIVGIFIIVVIAFLFIGYYSLKTTTQLEEEEPDRLIIDSMFITRANRTVSGDFFVRQNYSVKFGAIPWVKIKPNITLKNSLDEPTNLYPFRGDYLLINNSRFNTTNIILYGKKEISNLPNSYFYELEISSLNDTVQKWDIIFNNSYNYTIEINEAIIDPMRELKFINYSRNNLSLGDVINEDQRIIIRRVWIAPDLSKIYSNRSISLFFESKNTD
ncbi:MAG: hypothetical protein FIB08_09720 [Candidatus Methanoperedens sp.]|nr:hypothetical protein [Candidatus Methanoperedens sp.]